MTRDEELDAMDMAGKKADILKNIAANGAIRLTTRDAFSFWSDAVEELDEEGKVSTEFIEDYEQQYSYLVVRER